MRSATVIPARRKIAFACFSLILVLVFVGGLELLVRAAGHRPWRTAADGLSVSPGGRLYVQDDVVGYTQLPGEYEVTLQTGYTFRVTHLPSGLRVTGPPANQPERDQRDEVWIFGCSFTYGLTINDDETFPWLLQERFPRHRFSNFGVNGYGTVQSLIQFREALKNTSPAVAIVAYAGFHDDRNTFSRSRRKYVAPWNRLGPMAMPQARLAADGEAKYSWTRVRYMPFPFMKQSALVDLVETVYNEVERGLLKSQEVSRAVMLDMRDLAREHGARFVVAGISDHPRTGGLLEYVAERDISAVDISLDLADPRFNNLPHDPHPSALANQKFAATLETYLRDEHILR